MYYDHSNCMYYDHSMCIMSYRALVRRNSDRRVQRQSPRESRGACEDDGGGWVNWFRGMVKAVLISSLGSMRFQISFQFCPCWSGRVLVQLALPLQCWTSRPSLGKPWWTIWRDQVLLMRLSFQSEAIGAPLCHSNNASRMPNQTGNAFWKSFCRQTSKSRNQPH